MTDTRSTALLVGPTTPSAPHIPNESLAANLATLTKTPPKAAAPNSARKRRQLPDLSRSIPSPGHGAKMSNIFRDASTTLQALRSPPCRRSPNIKRSRLPFSQARNTRFGSAFQANVEQSSPPIDETEGDELISSDFLTPSEHPPPFTEPPEEVRYPSLEAWRPPQSSSIVAVGSSPGSDDQYTHSSLDTIGTNPPTRLDPDAQGTRIDSWLDGIPESTEDEALSAPQQDMNSAKVPIRQRTRPPLMTTSYQSSQNPGTTPRIKPLRSPGAFLQTSSNKENISPVKPSTSPTPTSPIPQYIASSPSRFSTTKNRITPELVGARRFVHPQSPQGHLNLQPKRKRARLDDNVINSSKAASKAGKDFTIHDDELVQALAGLSPLVERHRKGRGPKRERCRSYFDEDFVQDISPGAYRDKKNEDGTMLKNETKVLGESKQSAELTKSKPFAVEAGTATFNFQVQE